MDEYIPKLANFYLNIETIKNNNEYALSKHEFPFTKINDIENMGKKTRSFNVNCVFMDNPPLTTGWSTDEALFPTYEAHKIFLDKIDATLGSLVFVHPKYGQMNVHVERVGESYNDTQRFVRITLDLVEEIKTITLSGANYVVPQMATGWRETKDLTEQDLSDSQKFTDNLNSWNAEAQIFITALDSYLADIESPAKSIINTVNYTADLPSQVLSSINSAIDRVVQSFVDTRNVPASFINNCIFGIRQLKANFTGLEAEQIHIMGASRVNYEAGIQYNIDEVNRIEVDSKEDIETWDFAGNFNGTINIPNTMSIDELEISLAETKTFTDEAIQIDRDNRPLQEQAVFLQEFVNKIKLDRERIKTVTVPKQSLFQVLNSNGLNYQAIERILKLNPTIKKPNYTTGDVKILVDV